MNQKKDNNVILRSLLASTAKNICSLHLVLKELLGIGMLWGSYLMATILLQDPVMKESAPLWAAEFIPHLFIPTIIVSAITFTVASLKSMLPGLLAWVAVAPLYLLNFNHAALIALFIANAGIVLYGIRWAISWRLHSFT